MRTNHQRVFARSGSDNPVAGSLKIERKQFEDMSFVIDGQNQFICHVRFLFPYLVFGYLTVSPSVGPGSKSASSLFNSSRKDWMSLNWR